MKLAGEKLPLNQRPRDPQQDKAGLAWPACVSFTYSPGKQQRAYVRVYQLPGPKRQEHGLSAD